MFDYQMEKIYPHNDIYSTYSGHLSMYSEFEMSSQPAGCSQARPAGLHMHAAMMAMDPHNLNVKVSWPVAVDFDVMTLISDCPTDQVLPEFLEEFSSIRQVIHVDFVVSLASIINFTSSLAS